MLSTTSLRSDFEVYNVVLVQVLKDRSLYHYVDTVRTSLMYFYTHFRFPPYSAVYLEWQRRQFEASVHRKYLSMGQRIPVYEHGGNCLCST